MELKINTKRALEFEEKTGKDLLLTLQEVAKEKSVALKTVLALFEACGEGYDAQKFDEWEVPLVDKVKAIVAAVKVYITGKN